MKTLLATVLVVLIGFWGFNKLNENFSVENITLKEWRTLPNSPKNSPQDVVTARKIFDQPFKYLGKGRQSFVFVSQDDKYILKFIKCQRINVSDIYAKFPLPPFLNKKRQANMAEREDRLARHFTSMALAYDPLKEQTGLLFLHIEPTREVQKMVTLIDKLGFSHNVEIDTVPYALQIKAQKVGAVLGKLWKKRNIPELTKRLDQLIDLFIERASFGIINPDSSLVQRNNIGYTPTRAIYIDIGTFKRSKRSSDPAYLRKDFQKLKPIIRWLKSRDKKLARDFELKIEKAVNEVKMV